MPYKYVYLGGGVGAGYAAREYVKLGGEPSGLAIVSDEGVAAYERPALSKAFLFPENPARLPGFHTCVGVGAERQELDWYASNGIAYLTGTKIVTADLASKHLITANNDIIAYEKLIIGTGARPVNLSKDFGTPGADLKGIFYLRNVADGEALVSAMSQASQLENKKVICIGGGYIGMECAAALSMNGLDVTMVFPESRLMERLFTPELAAFYEGYYSKKGIKLVKGALAESFKGDSSGHVTHTVLKGGQELESSLVVVGVGARPNVDLFTNQLKLIEGPPGGIKVDSHLRCIASPGVWAVGDVAAFPQSMDNNTVTRQEHVANARASAAHAVADMLGANPGDYQYLPFFYSRVFSLSWQFYGFSRGTVVHYGDPTGGKIGAYWVDGGRIVGAFLESGTNDEFAAIKKVAQEQPQVDSVETLAQQGVGFAESFSKL